MSRQANDERRARRWERAVQREMGKAEASERRWEGLEGWNEGDEGDGEVQRKQAKARWEAR